MGVQCMPVSMMRMMLLTAEYLERDTQTAHDRKYCKQLRVPVTFKHTANGTDRQFSDVVAYLSARSQISFSGATSPSIENTPSVTMRRTRQSLDAMSLASKSAMSICMYLTRC